MECRDVLHPKLMIDNALAIDGWMSEIELLWLAETAQKSNIIVEFGSHQGRSTRALGDNCNGIVYAVDSWYGIYWAASNRSFFNCDVYDSFCKNLADLLERGKVVVNRTESHKFNLFQGLADLVFIDGDHEYKSVKQDIECALRIARKGAIISGHDYAGSANCPGVKQAVDEFFPKVNQQDSIWWVVND